MRWFTADWHLGETRMDLMGRPFDNARTQTMALVNSHNALLKPDDELVIIGDVCYKDAPKYTLELLRKFHCRKVLIRGNHDRGYTDDELKVYFDTVVAEGDGLEYEIDGIKCYATHYPTSGREEQFNLVGHIHGAWKVQLNMLNVGIDVHHFRPVPETAVAFYLNAITKFYDYDVWVGYEPVNRMYRTCRGKKSQYFTGPAQPPEGPAVESGAGQEGGGSTGA